MQVFCDRMVGATEGLEILDYVTAGLCGSSYSKMDQVKFVEDSL